MCSLGTPRPSTKPEQALARSVGRLAAGHGHRAVVEDDDGHVGVGRGGAEQGRDARMGEGRIADDRDGRIEADVGRAAGHADARAHADAGVDGAVGGQGAQGVAADVAEDVRPAIALEGLVERLEGVGVGAADAELGRPARQRAARLASSVTAEAPGRGPGGRCRATAPRRRAGRRSACRGRSCRRSRTGP